MKKINITLNKTNYEKLQVVDGGTFDKKLNVLMDQVDSIMPRSYYSDETKNVKCYEDTMKRIDGFKLTAGESRDNIIARMLLATNMMPDDEIIDFIISSVLNRDLFILGHLELNSHDLTFGEQYWQFLPTKYEPNGKNLTTEFNKWVSSIDWEEVKDLVRTEKDSHKLLTKPNYYLEINPF